MASPFEGLPTQTTEGKEDAGSQAADVFGAQPGGFGESGTSVFSFLNSAAEAPGTTQPPGESVFSFLNSADVSELAPITSPPQESSPLGGGSAFAFLSGGSQSSDRPEHAERLDHLDVPSPAPLSVPSPPSALSAPSVPSVPVATLPAAMPVVSSMHVASSAPFTESAPAETGIRKKTRKALLPGHASRPQEAGVEATRPVIPVVEESTEEKPPLEASKPPPPPEPVLQETFHHTPHIPALDQLAESEPERLKEADFAAILANWRIPTAGAAGANRAPTLVETGQAQLMLRACQLVGGKGKTLEEMAKAAASATPAPSLPAPAQSSSPVRKVKLTAVASQVDDTEVKVLSEADLVSMYAEYERVYGPGERPPKDCEPTTEQISALAHLLDNGLPPFADFAIFGPYGHRIEKKLKLSGVAIGRDGVIRQVELQGPPNIGTWMASYNVLSTILVMRKAVDLGVLLKYRSHVERLHDRYSEKIWAILYQAETRCRLELMDRLRREAVAEHEAVTKAGGVSAFDPARPWNTAWQKATNHEVFWREEVIEPGMLILTKVAGLNEMVEGDATVKGSAMASNPRETQTMPSRRRLHDNAGRDDVIEGDSTVQKTGDMNSSKCDTVMEPITNRVVGSVKRSVQFRVLYLFSGPKREEDGFEKFCNELGMECTCIDIEYNDRHDLLCQDFWESLQNDLDSYDAYLMSPPCSTFSMARRGKGGPAPLRGTSGKDRYGLRNLAVEDKIKVKEGTLLARRAHKAAERAQLNRKPWILEQPHWRQDGTSMFMLDEFIQLSDQEGVEFYTFDQCEFGCEFEKTTDLLSNVEEDIMKPFSQRCSHAEQWWIVPWSAEEIYSKHPPLRGKQRAIPWEEWNRTMLRDREPQGQYLTRSTAAYPMRMNQQLALCLLRACERASKADADVEEDNQKHRLSDCVDRVDPAVNMAEPLAGRQSREEVNDTNSLRNVHKWVTPKMMLVGKQVQNLIEAALDQQPDVQDQMIGCLGDQKSFPQEVHAAVDGLRTQIRDLLVRNRTQAMSDQCSVDQVDNGDYQTVVRADLMSYWAQCVGDPAVKVSKWLAQGAPAGISCDTSDLDGVCPRVDEEQLDSFLDLTTDYDNFVNYSGVEENEEAFTAIQSYADKGYLRVFNSLDELEKHVGSKPTLSKIGCIVKQKINHVTGATVTKTRIILDCKRSLVSKAATRSHKSVLPRVSDAIQSTLAMQADCKSGDTVTFLVADVVDAFWLIPLNKAERKYFCARLRGKFYCFHRTAQGSRAAPLTFAAIIALASRWVQSIVSTPKHLGMHTEEARVQTYVDDPLFTIRGSEGRQKRLTAVILVAWMVMGFPLAVRKATLSSRLTWIGVELSILSSGMEALVPQEKVCELSDLLRRTLQSNVVPKKLLRTIIGKAMSIASVIFCWRPFIQELYTALYVKDTNAPRECIWTKQVHHTILWLLTFLRGEMAGIRRTYTIRAFNKQLPLVTITWDASPFGMGATLQLDGVFAEYFAIQITEDDQNILAVKSGCHEEQQTWEALAGLVALRHWASQWQGQRARLQIRSDNIGALVMLTKLKGGSKALTLIAREYALDLGQAQWRPDLVTHVPGIANKTCDALSRRWDPSKQPFTVPETLQTARETCPGPRPLSWWKTLDFEKTFERTR
eukprot:s646_g22.t1